jgi:hypothetical protein
MKLTESTLSLVRKTALDRAKKVKIHKTANLHIHDELIKAGDRQVAKTLGMPIERDSALVFVDLAPACNWAHPCEYHLHDAETGKLYRKAPKSLPPSMMEIHENAATAFHMPVKMTAVRKRQLTGKKRRIIPLNNAMSSFPGERYAILFTGKAENRHTNDMEFLYRTLIDDYDFDAANIQVCNHDGTVNYFLGNNTSSSIGASLGNWPGDNTAYRMVVNQPGTRAGFQAAVSAIAADIKAGDLLFIHTNNHGGGPCDHGNNASGQFDLTDYCMYVYNATGTYWLPYYVNDFVTDLGALPSFDALMVMMEQCRSGGFIDPIINNSPAVWTHVAAAVSANDYSQGGPNFDPFAEDWIAGIHGQYADGTALSQTVDANGDGRLSATEAFDYANAVRSYDGTIKKYCPPPSGTPLRTGDTPTASDSPAGYGSYIFLGLPAHDLYLRDNLDDLGREPLVNGGISCSPDIIVYNQELLDPDATLATPAAQASDTLGADIEWGQDNFIYLRVQNRGSQPTSGTARLFWSTASVLPTPGSWHEITTTPVAIPSVNPQEMAVVGPIVWKKGDIPAKGHYCFIGLIGSGDDPAPDPATIHTIDDYYNFIRLSNNATWKNFNVVDLFANSVSNMQFAIQGWPRVKLSADLMIDLSQLPSAMTVKLKILKRLSSGAALENAKFTKESGSHQEFTLKAGKTVYLRGMNLKPSDKCQASMDITVPAGSPEASYRVAVAEFIDGKEMGRVTRLLSVGQFPFMGDRRTLEVHVAACEWAAKISPHNKEAFSDLDRAFGRGYDGCHYCLTEYSKD